MLDFASVLRLYVLPVLIICGIILNMLSFMVMKRLRPSTTSKYMSLLGLVDTSALLIGGLSLWAHSISSNFSITLLSTITCKIVPFLLYTLLDLSVFIIVIMTAERFYAVWRPLHANNMVQKGNFKITTLAASLLSSFINCHFLFTHSVKLVYYNSTTIEHNKTNHHSEVEAICVDTIWNAFYETYWVYIDASIYSFIPSLLLIIFNFSIIRHLFKAAEESLRLKNSHINQSKKSKTYSMHDGLLYINVRQSSLNSFKNSIKSFYLGNNNNNNDLQFKYKKNKFEKSNDLLIKRAFSQETNQTERCDLIKKTSLPYEICSNANEITTIGESKFLPNDLIGTSYETIHSNKKLQKPKKSIASNKKKGGNTRITMMLVVLNITFCLFSMPMVSFHFFYLIKINSNL